MQKLTSKTPLIPTVQKQLDSVLSTDKKPACASIIAGYDKAASEQTKRHAKPAKAPAKRKAASDKAKPKAAKAKAPAKPIVTHAHRAANIAETYAGLSNYLNANRKTAVKLANYPRTIAQLTPRTVQCLAAIRGAYKAQPFNARGLDNAIVAMLATSGLIKRVSRSGASSVCPNTGVAMLIDAPNSPLAYVISESGLAFGK